jgi:hypothetical protein
MGLRPRLRKPDEEAGLSPLQLPYGGSYHELLWSGQPFERLLPARPAPLDSGDAGDDAGGGLDVLRQALAAPIGTPPLHELARGRRSAAVLIPGKARRVGTAEYVPLLLEMCWRRRFVR